ncbi:MAG: hypothetical protein P4L80_02330 [Xanthobacteraceae bacterium]|nr:hypothetical protein [Xanthobacteraceae bacterium]
MAPAVWIARLIGPVFVAIGLGIVLNRGFYAAAVGEGVRSPVLIYLAGIASLVAGLAILNAHRTWTADWRAIVTILGWLLVIGGVLRIVLPRITTSIATTLYSGTVAIAIVGVIVFVVGAYLSFEGYRAK